MIDIYRSHCPICKGFIKKPTLGEVRRVLILIVFLPSFFVFRHVYYNSAILERPTGIEKEVTELKKDLEKLVS